MSAYNTESSLARLLRPHSPRGKDDGRTLLREAFALSGDLQIIGTTLHVRLDPASAPRRRRALAALCAELTATATPAPNSHSPTPSKASPTLHELTRIVRTSGVKEMIEARQRRSEAARRGWQSRPGRKDDGASA